MADILHTFIIEASITNVFEAITSSKGLDAWWTKRSKGKPVKGTNYNLYFGKDYDWEAVVSRVKLNSVFELQMTKSDKDWDKSKIGFVISEAGKITKVEFYHKGWKNKNEHFRISTYCWAMYLRLLKRYIEFGEKVPYEKRLSV